MANKWDSHVLPHGPLTQLANRLWMVTGSLPRGPMPRNMVVYRSNDGSLFIHSAIALNEAEMSKLEALGRPEVVVIPNPMHRLDGGAYKERFPTIQLLCPRAAREKVEEVVKVDGFVEEAKLPNGVRAHVVPGLKPVELCYELDIGDGQFAIVVTDAMMNLPNMPGAGGWLMRMLGSTGFFGMTRIGKMMLLKDRDVFRTWMGRVADRPGFKVMCVGHGAAITNNAQKELNAALARL